MVVSSEHVIDRALVSPDTFFIETISNAGQPFFYRLVRKILGKKIVMPMRLFKPLVRQLVECGCNHLIFSSSTDDAMLDPRIFKRLSYIKRINKKQKNVGPIKVSLTTSLLNLNHFSDQELYDLFADVSTLYIDISQSFTRKRSDIFLDNYDRITGLLSSQKLNTSLQFTGLDRAAFGSTFSGLNLELESAGPEASKGTAKRPLKKLLSASSGRQMALYPCWHIRNCTAFVKGRFGLCSYQGLSGRYVGSGLQTDFLAEILTDPGRKKLVASFMKASLPPGCLECPFYVPDYGYDWSFEATENVPIPTGPAPASFSGYTYPKKSHFKVLEKHGPALYERDIDPETSTVKVYQNLLVYAFLVNNIDPGSRILEVGGGNSLILSKVHHLYQCWNVDKFEGLGQGPKEAGRVPYKNVFAYMGEFSKELPANYFDFVFSISALEHVEPKNSELNGNIVADINRVLKTGGYSLHSLDVIAGAMLERAYYDHIFHHLSISGTAKQGWADQFRVVRSEWEKPAVYIPSIIHTFFNITGALNSSPEEEELTGFLDGWAMTEKTFNKGWKDVVKRSYLEVGRPTAINVLWQKKD